MPSKRKIIDVVENDVEVDEKPTLKKKSSKEAKDKEVKITEERTKVEIKKKISKESNDKDKETKDSEKVPINKKSSKAAADEEEITEEENLDSYPINPVTKIALKSKGIIKLFPIQYKTFNLGYAGKDVVGRAQTGTGKTFAFALPIIEHLFKKNKVQGSFGRPPTVLVLSPTRELAQQIAQSFYDVMPLHLKVTCIYGGTPYQPQENDLRNGIDVVVGTPGRINDHIQSGKLNLTQIDHVVLDEADEMLNFGFADAIEAILNQIPADKDRQTFMFSATLPEWVKRVASTFLKSDHVTVDLIGNNKLKVGSNITHYGIVVDNETSRNVAPVVAEMIKAHAPNGKTIVFVQRKIDAANLCMDDALKSISKPIHGDLNQVQRNYALEAFVNGKCSVLIATDVAARGLDIPNVDLVVQTMVPPSTETYTHRIGRTARAGKSGKSLTICTRLSELVSLERALGIKFHLSGGSGDMEEKKLEYIQKVKKQIKSIPLKDSEKFMETAKELIKKDGAEMALANALAALSGLKNVCSTNFSIMNGAKNITSIACSTQIESEIDSQIKKINGSKIDYKIYKLKGTGSVVDINSEVAVKLIQQGGIFSELVHIPDLVPTKTEYGGRNGGFGGRSGGFGGRNRGYGGRSGGFGHSGGFGGHSGGNGFSSKGF